MGRHIFARVNLVSFATVQGCHTTLFQAWISSFHSNNASFQEWANQREHSIFGKLFAPVLLPETRPIRPWLFSVLLQRALRLWVPLGCSVSIEAKCSLSCSCYRSCKTCGSIFWEKKQNKTKKNSQREVRPVDGQTLYKLLDGVFSDEKRFFNQWERALHPNFIKNVNWNSLLTVF